MRAHHDPPAKCRKSEKGKEKLSQSRKNTPLLGRTSQDDLFWLCKVVSHSSKKLNVLWYERQASTNVYHKSRDSDLDSIPIASVIVMDVHLVDGKLSADILKRIHKVI